MVYLFQDKSYQPILDKVSIFANHMNAFVNAASLQVTDVNGSNPRIKLFNPEHADLLEFGIKTNWFSDNYQQTFLITISKLSDPVTPTVANINDYDQRCNVHSKGFEADINANPAQGLNTIAGYSHNDIGNAS